MQYIVVFVTTPNKKEAKKITSLLLDRHIIACANIIENIDSYFWWNGKKNRAKECLLIAKTTKSSFKKLIVLVKDIHPYDVPEIIAIPILTGYLPYLDWLKEVVV